MKKITLMFLIVLLLGCTDGGIGDPFNVCDDCNDSISDYVEINGLPDDVETFEADNYWSVTYWYWCKGVSRTWVQTSCDCDQSTYTFNPICF
uniref:Uncharacterized protein n=1 Tax=viral metagenome TaxID=1070528 RepID=A0A6M3KTG0_9ZZZZ